MDAGEKAVRFVVHGRVQGVGYRAWAHHQAELHGLSGWVRNRRDGTVEGVLRGPSDLVDVVLKALHDGPRHAEVQSIDVEPAPSDDAAARGFTVRDTI
jgi:acylphosphatase